MMRFFVEKKSSSHSLRPGTWARSTASAPAPREAARMEVRTVLGRLLPLATARRMARPLALTTTRRGRGMAAPGSISPVGAVFAALIAVNVTGALFAISPLFLACFAVVLGVAWPTWLAEFVQRMQEFLQETRARGRGDVYNMESGVGSNKLFGRQQRRDAQRRRPLRTRYDRSRFHYYIQADGKRRWHRTRSSARMRILPLSPQCLISSWTVIAIRRTVMNKYL